MNDLRQCLTHGSQSESFILIFHTGSASEMYRIRAHVNQLLKKYLEHLSGVGVSTVWLRVLEMELI